MKTYSARPAKCPECSSSRIVDVTQPARPEYEDQTGSDIQSGQIVLGGCDALPDGPTWICADCQKEFYRPVCER